MTRGKLYMVLSIVSLIVIVSAALVGPLMSRVEEPPYLTIAVVGPIEVRTYGPIIVAETQVAGERQAAINAGFRLLAAYIFWCEQTQCQNRHDRSRPAAAFADDQDDGARHAKAG
jgi:hypothetical protein